MEGPPLLPIILSKVLTEIGLISIFGIILVSRNPSIPPSRVVPVQALNDTVEVFQSLVTTKSVFSELWEMK